MKMLYVDQVYEPDQKWAAIYDEMFPIFKSMRGHLLEDLKGSAALFKKYGF